MLPTSGGMGPSNWFLPRPRWCRDDMLDSDAGIAPVSLLFANEMYRRPVSLWPSSTGIPTPTELVAVESQEQ
jgi:hypothetical protein